jgi:hypothetical protein
MNGNVEVTAVVETVTRVVLAVSICAELGFAMKPSNTLS